MPESMDVSVESLPPHPMLIAAIKIDNKVVLITTVLSLLLNQAAWNARFGLSLQTQVEIENRS